MPWRRRKPLSLGDVNTRLEESVKRLESTNQTIVDTSEEILNNTRIMLQKVKEMKP